MKFRVKPEDFAADGVITGPAVISPYHAADRVNALLEAHEKTLPRVKSASSIHWFTEVPWETNPTHTALLWGIESIEDGK